MTIARPDPLAAERLRHRGPDEQGAYASESISLVTVRLKIIDLQGGQQPMIDQRSSTVAAFNGEIYNHAELRDELRDRGHRFDTQCDTEVLLKAFIEWDTRCFSRLRGMFAAALWQERERRLVLVRDRMGIKPLYWRQSGGELVFGSEMKSVLTHPSAERVLDETALDAYLSLNYVPGPRTMVRGVWKLPPGHLLEWQDGRTRLEPWWRLELAPERSWTLAAAMERLDDLLSDAIRSHLLSDVPLGVWLSGGLDSSTILHYAAAHSSRPLKTFSVSFAGRSFDESGWFREVTRHYGAESHELDLGEHLDLAGAIESLMEHCDEPMADAGALPVWHLSRLTRSHVTVALSGEGADELFGGYLTYLADYYARFARLVPAGLAPAGLAGRRGAAAGVRREDRLRVQSTAIPRRQPARRSRGSRLLERLFQPGGQRVAACPAARGGPMGGPQPAAGGPTRGPSEPFSVARSDAVSAG